MWWILLPVAGVFLWSLKSAAESSSTSPAASTPAGASVATAPVADSSGANSSSGSGNYGPPDPWTRFDSLFRKYGDEYGVDWHWLKAIALNESNLGRDRSVAIGLADPSNVDGSISSDRKSWGLMQITLPTAQQYDSSATPEMLNNPDYSVNIAAQLFADNMKQFSQADPNFLQYVVKSYNEGAHRVLDVISGLSPDYSVQYWHNFKINLAKVQGG